MAAEYAEDDHVSGLKDVLDLSREAAVQCRKVHFGPWAVVDAEPAVDQAFAEMWYLVTPSSIAHLKLSLAERLITAVCTADTPMGLGSWGAEHLDDLA